MNVVVIGAGVVGVTTAYMLSNSGYRVTLIDKAEQVCSGASKANGAQLSFSYTNPLASPETFRSLPKYFLGADPSVRFRKIPSLKDCLWGLHFFSNCRSAAYKKNSLERQSLAELSRQTLKVVERNLGEKVWIKTGKGKIVLRNVSLSKSGSDIKNMLPNARKVFEIEPALKSWKNEFNYASYEADDYALDTQLYCKRLISAANLNHKFELILNEKIQGVRVREGKVEAVKTTKGEIDCQHVIVCAGNASAKILSPLGIRLNILPLRGYSITLPSTANSPKVSITDLSRKIVYANLGDDIRIAGFLDWVSPYSNPGERIKLLIETAQASWPDIADFSTIVEKWVGDRPTTPSGIPYIGSTKISGLWVNTGHGSLGYTFAMGSAKRIVDGINNISKSTFIERELKYVS